VTSINHKVVILYSCVAKINFKRESSTSAFRYDAFKRLLRGLKALEALRGSHPLLHETVIRTRHDHAGPRGAPLTSHEFSLNLKRYATDAGIGKVQLHQTRHAFARMVAEDSGSIVETHDALGPKHLGTTKVYVQRIAVRRDRHSKSILKRIDPSK
jgi:integrase